MQHCHREAEFDKFMKWRANSPAELAADSSLRNMSYSNRVLKFWAAQGVSPLALALLLMA